MIVTSDRNLHGLRDVDFLRLQWLDKRGRELRERTFKGI